MRKLIKFYRDRHASPLDVTDYGENALFVSCIMTK